MAIGKNNKVRRLRRRYFLERYELILSIRPEFHNHRQSKNTHQRVLDRSQISHGPSVERRCWGRLLNRRPWGRDHRINAHVMVRKRHRSEHRVDPATLPGTARGRRALLVAGELTTIGVAVLAAFQAVASLDGFGGRPGVTSIQQP